MHDPPLHPARGHHRRQQQPRRRHHQHYPFSPVIDHQGADLHCPMSDQRGWTRPMDGDGDGSSHCDAGAVEYLTNEMFFGDNFEMGNLNNWDVIVP
ncbi:MAG: choice-of-anchor Q domain-containing protein [Thermoanaerobaculales bacterium]|nr:choice-of-anchor Q domain-containing protein [Thermoanaerobaculales bacterium]